MAYRIGGRVGAESGVEDVFGGRPELGAPQALPGDPTGDPTGIGGGGLTAPIEPLPGDAPPAPVRPPLPPPAVGATGATPLGAGTFQLPGGAGSEAFRSPGFLQNRFVGGRLGSGEERIGSPGGQASAITGGLGVQPGEDQQLDPELIRQMFLRIGGGR